MDTRRERGDAPRHRAHRRPGLQDVPGVRQRAGRLSRWPEVAAGRPVDKLLALYLLFASAPLLLPRRPGEWPLILAQVLAVCLLAWPPAAVRQLLSRAAQRWPRGLRLLLDWYPLLLVPLLYTQLAPLIAALHGGRFYDPFIQQLEQALFGGQPSRDLAAALPVRWLSEVLHAGYLSYYLIIYLPPLFLYLGSRRNAFPRAVFALLLAFTLHYLVFIYFPVQGPRYLFPSPAGAPAEGALYALTHRILEAGSSQGAAFPSSHVGVAVAQLLTMYRFHRRLAPALALLTVLLALGAVYGGFHYGVDALCGAVLGAAAALAAPAAYRLLGGTWRDAEPA